MNATRTKGFRGSRKLSYTLLELLAVMTIMALLLAAIVPSISGISESNNISRGGQLFSDQIALARQISSARNLTVEVRCINIPSRCQYGYSAIQLWSPGGPQSFPVSRMETLPDGIAISKDTTKVSSLFNSYQLTGTMPVGSSQSGNTYVSFTINPSGMVGPLPNTQSGATGLTPDMRTNLTVGILPARFAQNTTLPVNYMLVQLNPITAATLNYRP